jgi:hypothetical protein
MQTLDAENPDGQQGEYRRPQTSNGCSPVTSLTRRPRCLELTTATGELRPQTLTSEPTDRTPPLRLECELGR